jgi:hypothetical protein
MISQQQIQTGRIRRIIPYKTHVNNINDYNAFFKKNLASSHILDVEYLNISYYHNNEGRDIMQQRLVKLLRKAKPIKALHLHKCIIQYENIPNSVLIQLAKKVSRVKSLSLPDYTLSQELIEKYILWLKYTKGLKKFDYIAIPCADFPDGHVRKFEACLKKFFHEIKRDRINSLNIAHRTADERIGNSFLMFKQYPSTLKSLAFNWKHYSTDSGASLPEVKQSFSHMRNLTSVSLAFRNQANLLNPILSSIRSFSQLTSLNIEFSDNAHQDANLPFEKLSKLKRLNNLKLKFDLWPRRFEIFLIILENCPLVTFYLDAVVEEDDQLIALKNSLSRMKNLESLTLKIYKNSPFETDTSLRDLFEKVSQLKFLKNLKLHFFTSNVIEKPDYCPKIISALKTIFNKTIKLESFSFKFNQIDAKKTFLELTNILRRTAPTLRKLEVNVGEVKPEGSDYSKITSLIHRLKDIEVLKLNSLCVSMNKEVEDLLETVCNLKYLRVFELQEMKGPLNDSSFTGIVEKVLAKKGLNTFNCNLLWENQEEMPRRKRSDDQIDLKQIIKKNPGLQNYPQSSGMFVYYDDDTEWKWEE